MPKPQMMSALEPACPFAILRRHAANLITGTRVGLLFLATGMAISGSPGLAWAAVPLAVSVLAMDWIDGLAARHWGCASKLGGLLDIVGDRIAENVWWVLFAYLRWIPLWVPLVVLSRGFLTDAIRSYALSRGQTAFGKETMMGSRIGHALVASRTSRALYGISKALAFTSLFALNAMGISSMAQTFPGLFLQTVARSATVATVAFCLVRGIPVAAEFAGMLSRERDQAGTP